jgi:hypothetical protein
MSEMGMPKHPHISLVYVLNPLAHQYASNDGQRGYTFTREFS